MTSVTASSSRVLGWPISRAIILLLTVTTIFRFFYATWLPILPDEAYYFQWSRHLDASYFSKGPAVAYTIAAGTALFGNNNFGIRFFSVLLSAGTAWQIFLLARRWYDDMTGLVAVLIAGVLPLFAVGSVLMTIDPLSAFFWIWAAHLFSQALQRDRLGDWLWTGFAVGSGFLAKYLNALELVAFMIFLLACPARRRLLWSGRWGALLGVALFCTLPVWWWNGQHHWLSLTQLGDRGHLSGSGFELRFSTFANFLLMQAIVISPLIFLSLLSVAGRTWAAETAKVKKSEGDLLLLILFLTVFLFYAVLSWHVKCEANWPVVSYLTLVILLAARWRRLLDFQHRHPWIIAAFLVAWLQTLLLQDTQALPLSLRKDPLSRAYGWREVVPAIDQLREQEKADLLIADAYREASIFSYYLPGQPPIYVVRHPQPANQFDFWPDYPTAPPHRALWIRSLNSTPLPPGQFNTITLLQKVVVSVRGEPYRQYEIYLCENR